MGYQTIGLLAIGSKALGFSSGFEVKVGNDEPGPQRIRACSPVEALETECGMMEGQYEKLYKLGWVAHCGGR